MFEDVSRHAIPNPSTCRQAVFEIQATMNVLSTTNSKFLHYRGQTANCSIRAILTQFARNISKITHCGTHSTRQFRRRPKIGVKTNEISGAGQRSEVIKGFKLTASSIAGALGE